MWIKLISAFPFYFGLIFYILYIQTKNKQYLVCSFLVLAEFFTLGFFLWKPFFNNLGLGSLRPKYLDKDDELDLKENLYGMPSAHVANATFSSLLLLRYYPDKLYVLLSIIIVAYQRYITKMHSLEQILVGFFIGIIEFFLIT